jgi:hypothetical protein
MTPIICPKCDGKIDAFADIKWGDGVQRLPVAPFICTWCASILVFDLKRNLLYTPELIREKTGIDPVAEMKKNPPLWDAIEKQRAIILRVPNRRQVLR